jgi:hypothetical protein
MFAILFLIFTGVMRFLSRISRIKTLGSVWESGIILPAALLRMVIFTFRARNRRADAAAASSSVLLVAAAVSICAEYVIIYNWTSARSRKASLPGRYAGVRESEFWSSGATVRRSNSGVGGGDSSKSILDARSTDWWAWDGIDSFLLAGAGGAACVLLLVTLFYPNPPRFFLGILEFVVVALDVAPAAARAITALDTPSENGGKSDTKAGGGGGAWREITAATATVGDAFGRGTGAFFLGGPASFVGAAAATVILELAAANMASIIDSTNAIVSVVADTVNIGLGDTGGGDSSDRTASSTTAYKRN